MGRILVVEDSRTQAEHLRLFLEEADYAVELAPDAERALELFNASAFDLVLSDVVLPGESGYDLCRRLRQHPERGHVPILLLTSLSDPLDILRGLECGADNYVTKPFEAESLLGRIRYLFASRARPSQCGKLKVGVEVVFLGKTFTINSEREQILDLLVATCEDVVRANHELRDSREELETHVRRRTAELAAANASLRAERDFNSALLDTAGALVVAVDRFGSIVRFNRACERTTGYSAAEMRGRPFWPLIAPEERGRIRGVFDTLMAGRDSGEVENYWVARDGSRRLIAWSNAVLRDEGGRVEYALGAGIDVTERKRLEAQVRQAQKMEAVGKLAGGVAHDFNNLLTVINGYGEVVSRALPEGHPLREPVEEIKRAGERAATLTRQLLTFSRRQIIEPHVLDLNAVVGGMERMLHRLIGEDVALATALAPDLGRVLADPSQLEQVVLNLCVNARDAMPTGGRLTIETSNAELDRGAASLRPEVQPGRYVLLAVTDTGHGMDRETLAQVFEPFFTTKELGRGTGMGLATVYGIVKQAQGFVYAYSELGRGTTFKVYLPRVEEGAAEEIRRPEAAQRPAGGRETVLLVEDEEAVRSLTREVLAAAGYTILEATGGTEALLLGEQHEGTLHLLVTDVVMPGLGGRELAERLTVRRPGLRVLFLSGYPDDAVVRHGVLTSEVDFLQKPFTIDALSRKVREVLDR